MGGGTFRAVIDSQRQVRLSNAWDILEVPFPGDVTAAVSAYADADEFAWLDSSAAIAAHPMHARYSLICARPIAWIEQFERTEAALRVDARIVQRNASAWRLWRETLAKTRPVAPAPTGIAPGWVGYAGFEMARLLERLPATQRDDLGLPLMRMALYDRGVVLDHRERRAWMLASPATGAAFGMENRDAASDVERWTTACRADSRPTSLPAMRIRHEIDQATYERAVRRVLEYISAGDVYQVNIAQRFALDDIHDSLAVHAAIQQRNPAPHAACLSWPDGGVVSASPELFLQLRGRSIMTRPIKGTRPRTDDPVLDGVYREQLMQSQKDAAELAMIVDLHRNDLGRVCEYGSVRVHVARECEAHPTVFHTVADIRGTLRADCDAIDLLTACFPAGSITGAPKIRAIEIIDELEWSARGAYSGAVGVLGLDGNMTWNVAIRTLQLCDGRGVLHAGGGIVADSDPAEEYEETLAKARGMLEALGCGSGTIVRSGLH